MGFFDSAKKAVNDVMGNTQNTPVFDVNNYVKHDGGAVVGDQNKHVQTATGGIKLQKGEAISIAKTPVVKAVCSWSSDTDYDLYALVLMRDGTQHVCATFGSETEPPAMQVANGAVKHMGDVGRTGTGNAMETIEIRMNDDIAAIVPVAYSAQSNGTGSFRRYAVSMSVDNGEGDSVYIDARDANASNTIYSVAIAAIVNTDHGVVIENIEAYSRSGSENRPVFKDGKLYMDQGSRNDYK